MQSEKSHRGIASYFVVYAALLVLLAATVIASEVELGRLNLLVSLAIAICKAVLVVLFFMHVRASSHRVWIFSVAGFAWLLILIVLTMADYTQRPAVPDSGLTQIPLGVHDAERP